MICCYTGAAPAKSPKASALLQSCGNGVPLRATALCYHAVTYRDLTVGRVAGEDGGLAPEVASRSPSGAGGVYEEPPTPRRVSLPLRDHLGLEDGLEPTLAFSLALL